MALSALIQRRPNSLGEKMAFTKLLRAINLDMNLNNPEKQLLDFTCGGNANKGQGNCTANKLVKNVTY